MRSIALLPVCLTALLLGSCVGSGSETTPTDFCQLAAPIWIGNEDELTDETARQILRHNNRYEVLCGEEPAPAPSSGVSPKRKPQPVGQAV